MTVRAEDWAQVKELFEGALALSPDARPQYLKSIADATVREAVERLLRSHERSGSFLETPAAQLLPGPPTINLVGCRLGPYLLESRVGAGGMGEVYSARDSRLNRTVAIKVLPAYSLLESQARERLEREARAVAMINHPNICTLHDIGRQDEIDYLVMEFLEGETLAAKLSRGPLSVEQALQFAVQIASALDAAHRAGVIHRDLKPANVMLTKAGTKLLDFGVAKMTSGILASDGLARVGGGSATDLTHPGSIPGTLPYMAPEQLEGKEADNRSDLFAFGCVLYEMLTGRKAFDSDSAAGLVAAIMTSEPAPIGETRPDVPDAIAYILERCLAKDPDDRWQTARDLLAVLQHTRTATPGRTGPMRPASERAAPNANAARVGFSRASWLWPAAAAVAAGAIVAIAVAMFLTPRPTNQAVAARVSILPPAGGFDLSPDPRVSPDGRFIVFKAADAVSHRTQIWLRALDSTTAAPILGTEDTDFSCAPFWSPDSKAIGFFARAKLKRVNLDGGGAEVLAAAPEARGGTWTRDGTIVFNADTRTLLQIPASGGTAHPAMAGPVPGVRLFPYALPDGRHYLFTSRDVNGLGQGIYVGSLDSAEVRRVSDAWSPGVYAEGRLLFVRQDALLAQPFDLERLATSGDARQIGDHVGVGYGNPLSYAFSAAANGGLAVFWTGMANPISQLTWYSRGGERIATLGEPGSVAGFSMDSGAAHGVVELADRSTSTIDLWLFDPAGKGVPTRLTTDGRSSAPVFSPVSDRILVEQRGVGLFLLPLAGSAGRTLSDTAATRWPSDWSHDGRFIAFTESGPQGWSLWSTALETDAAPVAYRRAPFVLTGMTFAADARSVAYVSDESGQREVYVDTYPTPTRNVRVSTAGGGWPKWRRDGKELFYIAPDRKVMAVSFKGESSGATVASVSALFEGPPVYPDGARTQFAPSADGGKFLFNARVEDPTPRGLSLIVNWPALTQAR